MITDIHEEGERLLVVKVAGVMLKNDGDTLSPVIRKLIADHGPIRVLFDINKFTGWDDKAAEVFSKLETTQYQNVERIALLGDRNWELRWRQFCRVFTRAKVIFFEPHQAHRAHAWLAGADN